MQGEDPLSIDVEDAEHWIAVYTELVAMARSLAKPPPSARLNSRTARTAQGEMVFIANRLATLEGRLEFWRQRLTSWSRQADVGIAGRTRGGTGGGSAWLIPSPPWRRP